MDTVHAIFENGVFKPVVPVSLPEHAQVEFEPRVVSSSGELNAKQTAALHRAYAILSERYASGHTDTAARHSEHQP